MSSVPPSPPPSSSSSSSVSESTSVEATAAAHQQRRASRSSLPLVSSIKRFPKIKLTAEEQAHYDRVVGRQLYRAVQEYASYGGDTAKTVDRSLWTPVRKDSDMTIYRNLKGTGDPRVSLLLGLGKIEGSLEDVMDGLHSATSMELCTTMRVLTSRFIDGAIFHMSERRTPDDPFSSAGIKWFAMKTPGGALVSDRDLLIYERQGTTFDAEGNEVAYHLMQSVDRSEWRANTFKNLVRSHISLCYLYTRSKSKVKAFYWGEYYGSGSTPQLILNYSAAGQWLEIKYTIKVAEAKKLSQLREAATSRASDRSIVISDINNCYICQERRSFFSSQELCGGCQQNVCRACSKDKKLYELDAKGNPVEDRFCKRCLIQVAKQRGSKISWNGADSAQQKQPPAYFDLAFQSTASGRSMLASMTSAASQLTNGSSVIDTSYMAESLELLDQESSGLEDADWMNYEKRKKSHAERLSNSSSSYTKEQLLSELFGEVEVES